MGESDLDRVVVNNLIKKLVSEISSIKEELSKLRLQLDTMKEDVCIDIDTINKYKNFNYAYENADDKQKKVLMQDVVKQIVIDGEEVRIQLYIG